MSAGLILGLVIAYFGVLILISWFTSRGATNESFFIGERKSPWYIVAFGMIGASLSGITFISIPGTVATNKFGYMQIVIGYMLGYLVITYVLMPLYYRLNLTSIYQYLGQRLGVVSYKTGGFYFLFSRIIGAALRMYLVAEILHQFVFVKFGIPYELTVFISIALIWIYTNKAGIKTVVWTDTLQTLFMLIALGMSLVLIMGDLDISLGNLFSSINEADYGQWIVTEDPLKANYFVKQIIAGAFIAICMTGLDQDMMQKNLSCKNVKEAQWNMLSFGSILFFTNLAFLVLGALLFMYQDAHPLIAEKMAAMEGGTDLLFPTIALEGGLSLTLGIFFLIGLIAAAYSSADSALTALTTSVCIDFLGTDKLDVKEQTKQRKRVHIIMSIILLLVILVFKWIKSDNVIWELFKAAQYTYGPLLGMFAFGIFTKYKVYDKLVLPVAILAPIITYFISYALAKNPDGYQFGFELIVVNGLLTFLGLLLIKKNNL